MSHDHDHDHDHDHAHAHDHHDAHSHLPEPAIKIEAAGPARKRLVIEVPAERISAKIDDGYDSLQDEASVPGFRKGKVPLRLLEKKFGKEVRKDVCSQLISEGYSHAIEKHELHVIGEPQIKDLEEIELPDEGPLSFQVEIEVVPDIELPELKGLEVLKPTFEVEEDQVSQQIERFCEMYGKFQGVDESAGGDYITGEVKIALADKVDEPVETLADVQMLVPGESRNFKGAVSGILVDDLGKHLAGHKVGDDVSFAATGPKQYENEDLRDKKLQITVAIRAIERLTPLAREALMGQMGLENIEALNEQVRQQLEQQAIGAQQQAMGQQVTEHLMEKVKLDELPENMSAKQAEAIVYRRQMELMQQGVSPEDIEQSLAELRAASQEQARNQLKMLFILNAVAKQLEIEVDEGELNGRIVQMAIQSGRRPEQLRAELQQSGRLEQLYVQLREEKSIAKLLEDAEVKEVSAEEWRKARGIEEPEKTKSTKKKSAKKTTKKAAKKPEPKAEAKPKASKKAAKKKAAKKTTKKKP